MTVALESLRKNIKAGHVYRRADLAQWSNAIDRHLPILLKDGTLTKLSHGLYHKPKKTVFGEVPPNDAELVQTFLKDKRFLITSPNAYNGLGIGATQLYNTIIVYNHKRHGHITLGGREFDFRVKPYFPKKMSEEFLLVDLANNIQSLAEDTEHLWQCMADKSKKMNISSLRHYVMNFGTVRTKKFFVSII